MSTCCSRSTHEDGAPGGATSANFSGSAPSTNWTANASTSTTTLNGSAASTNWTATASTSTTTLNGSAASTNWTSTATSITTPSFYTSGTSATFAYGTATRYASLEGTSCFGATGTNPGTCDYTVVTAGTVGNFTAALNTAPGGTDNIVFTIMKNGAATGITCTIAGAVAISCADNTHTTTFAVGDVVSVRYLANATHTRSFTFTLNNTVTTPAGSDTNYVSLSTACVSNVLATCNVATIGSTGTLTNASLTLGANAPAGNSFTVTLMVNGAASASACTIAAGASTCTIAGGLALTAGTKVELRVVHTGATGLVTTATTALNETVTAAAGSNTNYVSLSTACVSTVLATCNVTTIPTAGTLTNANLTLGANAPAANSFTVTLMVNGAATASTCTIAAGASSCTIAGGLALAAGSTVELRIVHTGSTGLVTTATTALNELVTTTAAGADTNYVSLSTACVNTAVAPCNVATITIAGTLTNSSFTFGASVPAGDSFTVTLFRNAAATASACTIAAGASSCTIAGGLALAANDKVELRVVKTAGTNAFPTTGTTALMEDIGSANPGTTLTAPSVTTTQANDQVVRLYGTGATSLSAVAFNQSGTATATGFEDATQASAGPSGTATATSNASANWAAQTIALTAAGPGCQNNCWYGLAGSGRRSAPTTRTPSTRLRPCSPGRRPGRTRSG